jgi:hypothetical protein
VGEQLFNPEAAVTAWKRASTSLADARFASMNLQVF